MSDYLGVGVVAFVLLSFCVVWWLTDREPLPLEQAFTACLVCGADDFEQWAAELDPDDDEPALVVACPASDEHLLDLAYGLPNAVVSS